MYATYIHNLLLCVWLTEPLCKVGRVVCISPRCAILIAAEVTGTPAVVLYINCRASVAALVVHGSSKNILFLSLYTLSIFSIKINKRKKKTFKLKHLPKFRNSF